MKNENTSDPAIQLDELDELDATRLIIKGIEQINNSVLLESLQKLIERRIRLIQQCAKLSVDTQVVLDEVKKI